MSLQAGAAADVADGDGKSALSSLDKNGDIGFFDVVKQL